MRLVETGTRNRLVHVNRSNVRGNVLNIANERSDEIYDILTSGKTMRFLALGPDTQDGSTPRLATEPADEAIDDGRRTDLQLETRLGSDALQKKLLKIAREAQTAEEESGVNILYVALGFMTWFEDKSSAVPREAPLILLPVELVRNARTSTYDIRVRDDEILSNLPIQQRLMDDFGIALPELEIGEGWRPSDYVRLVEDVIAQRPNWKIEPDAIQMGFFSFSKLLMYRDLAVDAWPADVLADHPLARGLLYDGFAEEGSMFGPDDRLDDLLPPEKLFHVVDADASQAKVIEEVRSGRNLVVQGPPGTGKSQTIANMIAAAAHDGKRVLFVAEKMAALSVVHDRLVKVGLQDICLELHSRTASKKAVLHQLALTLAQAASAAPAPAPSGALRDARDRLNCLAGALHQPIGATGETPYSVLGLQCRFIGQGCPPPVIAADGLGAMTREEEARLLDIVERYGARLSSEGPRAAHPFEGVRQLALQPLDLARLEPRLRQAASKALALRTALQAPLVALASSAPVSMDSSAPLVDLLTRLQGLPDGATDIARSILAASDLDRLRQTLAAGFAWRRARDEGETLFVEAAFQISVAGLRAPLAAGVGSFFTRWGGAYRKASRELAGLLKSGLPKAAAERLRLADMLGDVAAKRAKWDDDRAYAALVLGEAFRGDSSNFERLLAVLDWCERLSGATLAGEDDMRVRLASQTDALARMRSDILEAEPAARAAVQDVVRDLDIDATAYGDVGMDRIDLAELVARLESMANAVDRYAAWADMSRLRTRLAEAGLTELADLMREGKRDAASARMELRFARAEKIWNDALKQSAILRDIGGLSRHALVATFADLERSRLSENVAGIVSAHLAQVPQGATGEMKVLRGEIGKRRGHIALRRLFRTAGSAVQRIKPVLLMSPISVAQFLPPGSLDFDLLLIDEASQVRPEDALGAIARAKQIVVVGDKKQLPPSSFFERLVANDESEGEDDDATQDDLLNGAAKLGEMESILTLCEARGIGQRMLNWHYRSRDPSLIAVSNREFYESGLILPPSPLQEDPAYGMCFTRVDGVYDRGGKRDNRIEGEAVIARVAQHARECPTLSLGIVTFSSAQRNLITELLEAARRKDGVLDALLREGQSEDLFVKNIENVQGDERDVILVSVGYGPATAGGRLASMSFGPVNSEGGARRLNVLFTRARIRCEIFASFDPGDIDVSRTSSEGPRVFRRFLEFAKSGLIEDASPTGLGADSPFEEDVADIIRSYGYLADPQVGSAGFRIDLGVRHPDRPGSYILAVECDGATYHNALWARERDRLRQDVLENLGWRFHRIWSTDWFYNRRAEIERLRLALEAARDASRQVVAISGANAARPPVVQKEDDPPTIEVPEPLVRKMPPYRRAYFFVQSEAEPHEAPTEVLSSLAIRIVKAEGPLHIDEIARRIAACFKKEKAGSRIMSATSSALALAKDDLLSDEDFWFTREQAENPPVRDRSAEAGATLKAAYLSMSEIRAALQIARADNAGGDDADLVRTAARLLGYRRVGPDLQARITRGLG